MTIIDKLLGRKPAPVRYCTDCAYYRPATCFGDVQSQQGYAKCAAPQASISNVIGQEAASEFCKHARMYGCGRAGKWFKPAADLAAAELAKAAQ